VSWCSFIARCSYLAGFVCYFWGFVDSNTCQMWELKTHVYHVWSHIQQVLLPLRKSCPSKIHVKSETLKLICILSPLSEAICNNWLVL
jgi:hypothetical protein